MTKKDYIAEAITEYYGERCADSEPGCPCCDAWAQYDAIREAALREAADELYRWGDIYGDNAARSVLALIDKKEG